LISTDSVTTHKMDTEFREPSIKITSSSLNKLCCPVCRSKLVSHVNSFHCTDRGCGTVFPVVNGIPILINESSSLFSIDDYRNNNNTFYSPSPGRFVNFVKKLVPKIGRNLKAKINYTKFAKFLLKENESPEVLILGGGFAGHGMNEILSHPSIKFIESDVSFGPRTALICDAHDIPFETETFDGVIIQAVLEHVLDPFRCADEIYRVLKNDGLVYAETAFMQQVHGGIYDYTRFTYLGHRRLFRRFIEIASGAICGSGMALAWAYTYFLLSFVKSKFTRRAVTLFAGFTSFWLKYFDYLIIDKPGTLDAASAYYFMGQKKAGGKNTSDML